MVTNLSEQIPYIYIERERVGAEATRGVRGVGWEGVVGEDHVEQIPWKVAGNDAFPV